MSQKADQRNDIRRTVFLGEGIKVTLKDDGESKSVRGEALDISPWGVSVFVINQKLTVYPKTDEFVRLHYTTRDKKLGHTRGKVTNISEQTIEGAAYLRFGIEFEAIEPTNTTKIFDIPDIFSPHAWCNDPFFFQEKILFKITNFNSIGMCLITSARNKTLIPNVPLTFKIYLPMQGEFECEGFVLRNEQPKENEPKDRYRVFIEFIKPNTQFLQMMVEYILICGIEITPQELRDDKLPVSIIEKSLIFSYANEEDFSKVIDLRTTSSFEDAIAQEKINQNNQHKDEFDNYSRQIICRVGKRLIACARIVYNNKDKSRCEISNYVMNIPEWLWAKKFVELSRFAWDREYRESDVFINMIRNVVKIVIESNHTHILTSAPSALKQLYLKVGFQPIQLAWKGNFTETKKNETPLLLDAKTIISNDHAIDKIIWNKVYLPIAKYLGF